MSKSLVQFIIEEQRAIPGVSGNFTGLISDIIIACKQIAHDVNKGELIGGLGRAGSENVQGETQKKLDIITNEVFIKSAEWGGHLAAMASEEMDDVYPIPAKYPKGKYLLVFDPLDGSSNIDVNISVGTIFSILRAPKGVAGKTGPRGINFNMRWVASMVAEVHRILTRGGVFLYPKDTKDPTKGGKLRLLYEANPMSFIVEQAGGISSSGYERIMDIKPSDLHQRVPVILGSKNEVARLVRYHKEA